MLFGTVAYKQDNGAPAWMQRSPRMNAASATRLRWQGASRRPRRFLRVWLLGWRLLAVLVRRRRTITEHQAAAEMDQNRL